MGFKRTSSNFYGQKIKPHSRFLKHKRLVLLFFFLLLFLKFFELPLKAEVDYFEQMGVLRPDKTIYAPNFVLPDLNGNKIGLSKYQGLFVMLNFWATW